MKSKEMLKKMKMPPSAKKDDMLEFDDQDVSHPGMNEENSDQPTDDSNESKDEAEESPQDEASESPEQEKEELGHCSDDDLKEELEARGFTVTAPEKGEGSAEEESKESPEEEASEDEKY